MLKKNLNILDLLLSGAFFTILGILFLVEQLRVWNWLYIVLVVGLVVIIVLGTLNLIINWNHMASHFSSMVDLGMDMLLLLFASMLPNWFPLLMPRIIGIWLLIHAIVKGFKLSVMIRDHLKSKSRCVILLVLDSVFAFALIVNPFDYQKALTMIMGGYLILYGLHGILKAIRELIPGERVNLIALATPQFLSALLPPSLFHMILSKSQEDSDAIAFHAVKEDIPIDLEVMVHIAAKGPAKLGHVDLVYQDYFISYGCYDPHHRHVVGTYGDGVILMAKRDDYLRHAILNENKVIIGFGLHLNHDQKEKLETQIEALKDNLTVFFSDEQLQAQNKEILGDAQDYLSRVTRNVKAVSYTHLDVYKRQILYGIGTFDCIVTRNRIIFCG